MSRLASLNRSVVVGLSVTIGKVDLEPSHVCQDRTRRIPSFNQMPRSQETCSDCMVSWFMHAIRSKLLLAQACMRRVGRSSSVDE